MKYETKAHQYFNIVITKGHYSTKKRLKYKLEELFGDIDLKNKNVLDIGGGIGLVSLYAASMGANRVVCVEPESSGSGSKTFERFKQLKNKLDLNNTVHLSETIQEYDSKGEKFDIILMENSINHLDEEACKQLLVDPKAERKYNEIFKKIYNMTNEDGIIIATDCSRYNFFGLLNIHNPFAPSITWELHQAPEIWSDYLQKVGFTNPEINWTSFNRLGHIGKFIFSNKVAAYFLKSHFRLVLDKI